MTRPLSLAHLSAIDLSPPDLVHLAAETGFDSVGLRLIRVTETSPGYPLMRDRVLMRATKAALADTGLRVNDVEFVRLTPEMDLDALEPFLDAGAELRATEIIAAPYDPEVPRLVERLGHLSERAGARGLGVSLEFFPWTPEVPDLAMALEVVTQAGPRTAVLVDALHFDRSGSTPDQLRAVPPGRLRLAHLCDAPVAPPYDLGTLLHTAREARLPPGEGQIDLTGFVAALPPTTAIGVEVPMPRHGKSRRQVLAHLQALARAVLGAVG